MTEPEVRARLIEVLTTRYANPEYEEHSSWKWLSPEDVADYVLDVRSVESVVKSRLKTVNDLKELYGLFYPPLADLNDGIKYLIGQKLLARVKSDFEKATTLEEYAKLTSFCWNRPELQEIQSQIEAKIENLSIAILEKATTLSECMDVYEHLRYKDGMKEKVLSKASGLTFTFAEAAEAIKRISLYPDEMRDMLLERMIDLAQTADECTVVFEESHSLDGSDLLSIRKMVKFLREQ